ESADLKGQVFQFGGDGCWSADAEAANGVGAAGGAGGNVDVGRRRMVTGAETGSGVAIGHGNEDAVVGGVNQRLIQRVELTADAARATAPGVVEDVSAIGDDVFQ